MDYDDFLKAQDQLKKGYKRQLQDLVLQGCVFFNTFLVRQFIDEVLIAATPPEELVPDQHPTADTPF